MPAARLGLGYRAAGIKTLMDLVGPSHAKEIFFTGRHFTAQEALGMGLINRVVPDAELDSYVDNYCKLIGENAPLTMHAAKRTIEELTRLDGKPDFARLSGAGEGVLRLRGLHRGPHAPSWKSAGRCSRAAELGRSVSRRRRSGGDGGDRRALRRHPRDRRRARRQSGLAPSRDDRRRLPWAWAAVKPLYLQGIADRAAVRFRESMSLPQLGSLAGEQPQSVDDVLASYDHSNTINLFALGALVAWLRGETAGEGTPRPAPRLPAPDVVLPQARVRGRRRARNLGAGAAAQPLRRSASASSWPACIANSRMRRRSCARSKRRWRRSKPTARSSARSSRNRAGRP